MNNKKGFTLIELLAVIVILAVLALIVTPIVTNIISKAKACADLRSAEGYVKAGEDFYAKTLLDTTKASYLGSNVIDQLEVSSKKATGRVIVNPKGSIEMAIVIGNKCYKKLATGTIRDIEVIDDVEACGVEKSNGTEVSNSTEELSGTELYNIVINSFPFLEIGEDGCKTSGNNNYTYMGGCYLKGNVTNNYLWYNGFLWRIMGINSDGSIRMMTEENVTTIPYDDDSSSFTGSYAEDWLNNYFYSHLRTSNIIEDGTWCNRGSGEYITDSTLATRTTCSNTITDKVGLISLDEYNLSGNSYDLSLDDDHLVANNSQIFWTSTPSSDSVMWVNYKSDKGEFYDLTVSYSVGLRPVINVSANANVAGGNGVLNDTWNNDHSPYILSEDVSSSSNLKDKASSGEYVKLSDKIYRVVSTDESGTKLIYDGYYEEPLGTIFNMSFGSDNKFSLTTGVGQKLNGDVLNWLIPSTDADNRNKLVTDSTWYQSYYEQGYDCRIILYEDDPVEALNATIGLIRMGEMLSGQSYSIGTKSFYWTLTSYSYGNTSDKWFVNTDGHAMNSGAVYAKGLRPVIVVKSDTQITSGEGTPSSPYEI